MTTCVICPRPVDGTAYACQDCANGTADWLTRAAGLVVDAHEAAAGLVRYGRPGPRSDVDPPMLGNVVAADRLAHAGTTITTWARHVAEERGQELAEPARLTAGPMCRRRHCQHPSCAEIEEEIRRVRWRGHPVAVAATWLVGQLGWLRHRSYAAEALTGLGEAARTIVRGADRPPEQVIVGACECGSWVYGRTGADVARCLGCEQWYDVKKSRATLERAMDDMRLTAAGCATLAARAGYNRRTVRNTVNVWGRRGAILTRGHDDNGDPLYRFGDVRERLARLAATALAEVG